MDQSIISGASSFIYSPLCFFPRVDPVKTVANIIHFSGSTKVFTKIVSHFYDNRPNYPLIIFTESTLSST